MTTFNVHTTDSAPEASQQLLEGARKKMGFVPNLYGTFAEAPALLEAYLTLGGIFDRSTSFNATERQVVLLSTSFENECEYCMAAHTTLAGMQRVPGEVVQAVRSGEPIEDGRLQALASFTRKVVTERGWVPEPDVQAFLDAGFTRAQVLEVVLGVGMKTLSNYATHMAQTPVDEAFAPNAWERPSADATHECDETCAIGSH